MNMLLLTASLLSSSLTWSTNGFQIQALPGSARTRSKPSSMPPLTMTTSFAPVPRGHVGTRDRSAHVSLLDGSLRDLTGRGVYERMGMDASDACCCEVCLNQRHALLSHGPEEDPSYNYGNGACLTVLGCTWDELCNLPARRLSQSGEDVMGTELMERGGGYVEGAEGVWVTHDGRPFRVHDMLIWNCYDEKGKYYGQAAMFDRRNIEDEPSAQ